MKNFMAITVFFGWMLVFWLCIGLGMISMCGQIRQLRMKFH